MRALLTEDERRRAHTASSREWQRRNPAHHGEWYRRNAEEVRAKGRAYHAAHKVEAAARSREWRKCNAEKVRDGKRVYYAANSERERARSRARQAANREELRAKKRAYYADHSEGELARARDWRAAHPEKARAGERAWHAAHPEKKLAANRTRRMRKLSAGGRGVTAAQWAEVLAASLGICAYCNERRPLTLDHIEPLSRDGEHDIDNVSAVCKSCNSSKHNKLLLLWLIDRAAA